MKNILAFIFSFVLVLPVAAQVTSTPDRAIREGIRKNIQNIRMETKQEIQGIRQTTEGQIRNSREDFEKTIKAKRAELEKTIQTHRDALKAKLQKIKDERKKAAVDRIDQSLTDLNSRTTTHYTNVLNQIEDVLGRVISRTDKAQANGKDVTAVRTVITNAQKEIASARAAVAAQIGKVYSMNITNDAGLKGVVGTARKALHDDLKKVMNSVKAARDAVRQAAVSLAQIRGVDKLHAPTSTATSTNSRQGTSTNQ